MFWISILRPSATALWDRKATGLVPRIMGKNMLRDLPPWWTFPPLVPLRMRGYCYCGDTYGRYGVKLPNRTAGLTGPDDFVMILVCWFGFGVTRTTGMRCWYRMRQDSIFRNGSSFEFRRYTLYSTSVRVIESPMSWPCGEGCDCSGPYFAYQSNCVWEQTTGRYGQEPQLGVYLGLLRPWNSLSGLKGTFRWISDHLGKIHTHTHNK